MFTQEKKQSLSLSPCLLKKVVQPVGTDRKPHENLRVEHSFYSDRYTHSSLLNLE